MSRKRMMLFAVLALCLALGAATLADAVIRAAPGEPDSTFSISWWTVDSGGGSSQGGAYRLDGSIGQPDAGRLSGGSFKLSGGFRGGGWSFLTHMPLISR